jgi:5-carboxymethyl-2-hydroxymuconate isomerase
MLSGVGRHRIYATLRRYIPAPFSEQVMPHLIVEFSDDPSIASRVEPLLDAIHRAATASGLFDESHIRVRALPYAHYRVGGKREPFIHVQCRLHAGRSEAQKRQLSEAVLAAVRGQGWVAKVITVEVVEMDRDSYAKYVLN